MLLASDVLFSPFTPQFFAFEKGIPTLVEEISFLLGYLLMSWQELRQSISMTLQVVKQNQGRLSLNLTPVIAILMILLLSQYPLIIQPSFQEMVLMLL